MPRDDRGLRCRAFVPTVRMTTFVDEIKRPREAIPYSKFVQEVEGKKLPGVGLAGLLAIASVVLSAAVMYRSGHVSLAVSIAIVVVFAGGAVAIGGRSLVRANWPTWRRVMLAEGHCPSCGYGLMELKEQEDGCRVCAECGAAWRVQ
jgi:hypothetical protein